MSAMIIFVGPDGGGKSTIVRELQKRLSCNFFKGAQISEEDTMDEFFKVVLEAQRHPLTICDRLYFPDDIIYAPLLRGSRSPLAPSRKILEKVLELSNALIIYVYAENRVLEDRCRKRGDTYITPELIPKITENYSRFFWETFLPWVGIDTTHKTPPGSVKIALDYIRIYFPEEYSKSIGGN